MSPKEQDGTQSRRTETGGSPHPANNRPDEFLSGVQSLRWPEDSRQDRLQSLSPTLWQP